MTNRRIAKPVKNTARQVAECQDCGELIEKWPGSVGWYHFDSALLECETVQ